jgi:hypothetical protein
MDRIRVRTASRLWFRLDAATRSMTRTCRRWRAALPPILSH